MCVCVCALPYEQTSRACNFRAGFSRGATGVLPRVIGPIKGPKDSALLCSPNREGPGGVDEPRLTSERLKTPAQDQCAPRDRTRSGWVIVKPFLFH